MPFCHRRCPVSNNTRIQPNSTRQIDRYRTFPLRGFVLPHFGILFTLPLSEDGSGTPCEAKVAAQCCVHGVSGYTTLACIGLIAIVALLPVETPLLRLEPILWLEAIAVVAFGLSWLTKGGGILKDNEA